MKKGRYTIHHLTVDAMLAALCAVLGYLAIDVISLKVTFESLPILLGALLFGPLDGLAVGGVGTLIYQLLRYGVSVTTPLWMIPYMLCGLLAGWYARSQQFSLSRGQTLAVVAASEFLITLLNTGVIYVDSKLFGYYTPSLIWGSLGLRLLLCAGKAAVFGAVLPGLLKPISKALDRKEAAA